MRCTSLPTTPLLLSLLCLFLLFSQVTALVVTQLQPGVNQEATILRKEDVLYFKADQSSEAAGTYLRTVVSGCSGYLTVYVRVCDPTTQDCTAHETYVPTRDKYDYRYVTEPSASSQGPIVEGMCLNKNGLCNAKYVYFYAIEASFPGDKEFPKAGISLFLFMRTFHSGEDKPIEFTNDRAVTFDLGTKTLSWTAATFCYEFDTKGVCTKSTLVPGARYKVFYAPNNVTVNLGTACGMTRYATAVGDWSSSSTSLSLSSFLEGQQTFNYVFNVLSDSPSSPMDATVAYKAVIVSQGSPHRDSNMILQIIVVLFFLGLTFIVLSGAVIVVVVALYTYVFKKRESYDQIA